MNYYGYPYIALTGGVDGALDSLDGSLLKNGDFAVVVVPTTNRAYIYTLDEDSAVSESSPNVISPDSNAGDKRWVLATANSDASLVAFLQAGTGAIERTQQSKSRDLVYVDDFGAEGDDSTDCTAAIQAAIDAAGATKTVMLGNGIYRVTATDGNYALTTKGQIVGHSPSTSIIKNVGAGSAIKLENYYDNDTGYYLRFKNFSVVGNSGSQDGVVMNPGGGLTEANGYCIVENVDSYGHGRNGWVHSSSWGTKYLHCKFYENLGLGFWLKASGTAGANHHNNIVFINCESRWNGGTGAIGAGVYDNGGYRLDSGINGVHFFGGIAESNNNWDFIIGQIGSTSQHIYQLSFKCIHGEDTPRKNGAASYSTTGGKFIISGVYQNVEISHCHMTYGAGTGGTGYFLYVENAGEADVNGNPCSVKEHDNYLTPDGGGTNIRDHGMTCDWIKPVVSQQFGDFAAAENNNSVSTILESSKNGAWYVTGTISCKKYDSSTTGVYPFSAGYDPRAGGNNYWVSLASALGTAPTIPPTIAWSGNNLRVSTGPAHFAFVTVHSGGITGSPPSTFKYGNMFNADLVKRSWPVFP